MRTIDTYGLKICNFQAELFQKSLTETTCSSKIFIRRFMHSDLAKRMDTEGFLFDSIDVTDALSEIENHINLYEKSISGQNERKNGVHITTFHGAKGLEFDCVIIPDCNEGIIPHRRSMCDNEIEEERRMFYVAVTRAKKELLITYVKGSHDSKSFVSRFIKEVIK